MQRPTDAQSNQLSSPRTACNVPGLDTPSLLIANATAITIVVDALLWYRWAVGPMQNAGWLFDDDILSLLVLTLLLNLRRLTP